MVGADVLIGSGLAHDVLPRGARRDVLRVERAFRGHRVGKRILVGPRHRIAHLHGNAPRLIAGAVDEHGVARSLVRGPRAARKGERRREREARGSKARRHGQTLPCSIFACWRCASIAGRTFTMSSFSSAFFAFGMSTLSIASGTCWWYATSWSM